jgi:hypothetical protein
VDRLILYADLLQGSMGGYATQGKIAASSITGAGRKLDGLNQGRNTCIQLPRSAHSYGGSRREEMAGGG